MSRRLLIAFQVGPQGLKDGRGWEENLNQAETSLNLGSAACQPAVQHVPSCLTSLSLSFLICKTGVVALSVSQSWLGQWDHTCI